MSDDPGVTASSCRHGLRPRRSRRIRRARRRPAFPRPSKDGIRRQFNTIGDVVFLWHVPSWNTQQMAVPYAGTSGMPSTSGRSGMAYGVLSMPGPPRRISRLKITVSNGCDAPTIHRAFRRCSPSTVRHPTPRNVAPRLALSTSAGCGLCHRQAAHIGVEDGVLRHQDASVQNVDSTPSSGVHPWSRSRRSP